MKTLNRLKFLFSQYELDCNNYKLKPNSNAFIIKKQSDLIDIFNAYINELDQAESFVPDSVQEQNQLLEVIRKQAMIIEAAGIVYPTINQDIRIIQDYYLIAKDRINEVPSQSILPVVIKVV